MEYRELADKISRVEVTMAEKIGEVLASVRGLDATLKSGLEQIGTMREDVEKVKEMATKAKDSTDSAHKRIDALRPLSEANLVERVKGLETIVRWAATLIIGAVILAVLGVVLVNKK